MKQYYLRSHSWPWSIGILIYDLDEIMNLETVIKFCSKSIWKRQNKGLDRIDRRPICMPTLRTLKH